MNRDDYLQLLSEKSLLASMIAGTDPKDSIDLASLTARLRIIESALGATIPDEREPARVWLTFKGGPVIDSHGIFVEFGARAVNAFAESVTAMAASLTAPLAAMGPIPNRDRHQLIITSTAVGSFGFELEEYRGGQLTLDDGSAVAHAIDLTQSLLRGTQGTDDELADSVAEADQRALDKVRAFLVTLADNDAVCTVRFRESVVTFSDVGLVRTSINRLSRDNLREDCEILEGELQGVLPKARTFEFKLESSPQVIRGKIGPAITDADALNELLHRRARLQVMVTRVGSGRPRYLMIDSPELLA